MDHQKSSAKSKNTILKFLPRATSSVSFQNPPIYSPSKDKFRSSEKPHKSHLGVGFSGPMVSMITSDHITRRKTKNHSDDTVEHEPTSPRVSCIGQVKCKYTHRAGKKLTTATGKLLRLTSATPERTYNIEDDQKQASKTESKSKKTLGFKKLFSGLTGKKNSKAPVYIDKVPSLGTMKRFSSGRDKLPAMDSGGGRYGCDDEDVVVPSSAPVMIRNTLGFDEGLIRVAGNREPRKEINLWKRRTMPQPKPLLLSNI